MNFKHVFIILPMIMLIKGYKFLISPILGNNCRFHPTCSSYMIECLKEHGVFLGLYLGVKRIFRCHPFGGYGIDPVPKKIKNNDVTQKNI